jgi:cytochrome P450
LVFEVIEERRSAGTDGKDMLTMLLSATHEDGSPASPRELRDELMGTLIAGRITTATQLTWAFERLAREPDVLTRLYEELDDPHEAYLTATIQEVMRHRPVLTESKPRLVKHPVTIGGISYPPGVALIPNAYLLHHDPAIYPEPYAFRPERFLERPPGTYTWIPFGGGRRRCLGANLAMLEMKLVIRTVLERCELNPVGDRAETVRRRLHHQPVRACRVTLRDRHTSAPPDRRRPFRS